jgi:hypothetical protein
MYFTIRYSQFSLKNKKINFIKETKDKSIPEKFIKILKTEKNILILTSNFPLLILTDQTIIETIFEH